MSMRSFFTKKKIVWTIILLLIIGGIWYFATKSKNTAGNIQTDTVSRKDLQQTVLTTGQVVSQVNLNLSFQSSGVVDKINVAIGDRVRSGDVLATLSQSNVQAALVSAQGSLAQAQANYKRVVTGASSEQINVSQKAVDAAYVAYNNALAQLANTQASTAAAINQAQTTLADLQSPTTQSDNKRSTVVTAIAAQLASVKSALDKENQILNDNNLKDTFSVMDSASLNYFKTANQQVQPLLDIANASLAQAQAYKSDDNIYQAVAATVNALNQNISALNYCFTALQNSIVSSRFSQAQLDAYKLTINTELATENSGLTTVKSSRQILIDALTAAQNAVTNANLSASQQITTAQNQINSARAAWQQAEATLAQQKAKAQPADMEAARAQLLSAQGQVDAAQVTLNNTILKAPADGTITQIDTKVGQQVTAMQAVIILQDMSSLHTEAYVSEANVASLQINQGVDYTFDALGPDRHFNGNILVVNPASTVISGVVNYLVKASLPGIPDIKPGMTVNMTIAVANKKDVLAVPASAVIDQDGKKYVRVIDDTQKKTYHQVPVQIGLQADGGLVEIISGLNSGQEVVTYIKP